MTTPKTELNLSNIFDVELKEVDKPIAEIELDAKVASVDSLETQREYVKSNLVKLIERGMRAVDDLHTIAGASEKSRDFEVLSGLIKTVVDTNIQLLDAEVVHKPKLTALPNQETATTINNTAVFVGQTTDLAKFIRSQMISNQ